MLEVEHKRLDAVVVACLVHDVDKVPEPRLRAAFAARARDCAVQRVAREFLDDAALRREHERRLVRDIRELGLARRKQHAEQREQQDQVQDLAQAVEGIPDALQYGPESLQHGHLPSAPELFLDAGRLAGTVAQEIQLRAAHLAAALDLDVRDRRAVRLEHALDTLAMRHLAHRE